MAEKISSTARGGEGGAGSLWDVLAYMRTPTMDGNHDSQQQPRQGQGSVPPLNGSKAATAAPATATAPAASAIAISAMSPLPAHRTVSPPPLPTPPLLPARKRSSSASLGSNTPDSSPHPAAVATSASPQDYDHRRYAFTSWSPQHGSSSLPSGGSGSGGGGDGDSLRTPQSVQGGPPDQQQQPSQDLAPGDKRKHASPSVGPHPHSPNPASPDIGCELDGQQQDGRQQQDERQQQAPKKRRRVSKAAAVAVVAEGRSRSVGGSDREMAQEKTRLTEQEKKNNHIASEQKRRLAIREGFDRLTEIVPGLEGQGRSESIVLKKCRSLPPTPTPPPPHPPVPPSPPRSHLSGEKC